MRICLIAEFNSSGYGVSTTVERLRDRLEAEGVNVSLNNQFEAADIIHAHTPFHLAFYAAMRYQEKPKLATIHGNPQEFESSYSLPVQVISDKIGWNYFRFLYSNYDELLTPTPYMRQVLEEKEIGKALALSNGVDLEQFRPQPELAERFKDKYGLDNFFLSVGQIIPRKGLEVITNIAEELEEESANAEDYQFVHLGAKGVWFTPFYQEKIKLQAPANMNFLGYVSEEDLLGAYSAAEALIHPSYREAEGLVILEALACGTPVIARDLAVYQGTLEDGHNSLLCENREEFKDAIKRMRGEKLRKKLQKNCRASVQDKSLERVVQQQLQLYHELRD